MLLLRYETHIDRQIILSDPHTDFHEILTNAFGYFTTGTDHHIEFPYRVNLYSATQHITQGTKYCV